MNVTLFLAIFTAFSMTMVFGQCPNSTWIHRGNKCYFLKREKADLYENIALCNELNASLVSIVNEQENHEIHRISVWDDFWLGLALRSKGSEAFYWFDGSPFVYNRWESTPKYTNHKYWAAYFRTGTWYEEDFSAFGYHNQMCSINLKASVSFKKMPNPADMKETHVTGQCPNSKWMRRGNKCYFVKKEAVDLYENIAFCNQLNASLVSIASEEENIHLTRLIPSSAPYKSVWLGLGQKSKGSKEFYWFDGSPFVYSSWYTEPQLKIKYFGVCLKRGEWFIDTAFTLKTLLCSLDLSLNATSKQTPEIPSKISDIRNALPRSFKMLSLVP